MYHTPLVWQHKQDARRLVMGLEHRLMHTTVAGLT